MSDRLRQAGNLTSDEDVALMQWTMKENESYHDWRMRMDKGLDEQSFTTMSKRFIDETGNDEVTGNLRLMNTFGLSTYTQADELRKLMIKMNGRDSETGEKLTDTQRGDAQAEFQKKMEEIKDGERPEELTYLENINTTMETTQTEVTGRLDKILDTLQEYQDKKNEEATAKEDATRVNVRKNVELETLPGANHNPAVNSINWAEAEIAKMFRKKTKENLPELWNHNLRSKFDKDENNKLDKDETNEYKDHLKELIAALSPLKDLEAIKELLESGISEN